MSRLSQILIALLMLGTQPRAGIAQWVSRPTFHTVLDTLRSSAAPPSAAGADSSSVRLRTQSPPEDPVTRGKFEMVGWVGGFFGGIAICKAQHFERRNFLLAMAMVVPCGTLGGFAGALIGNRVYHATH